jgi:hypothetical protein
MPSYYIYLISSLPALSFGAKPPFSLDEFIDTCSRVIPNNDSEKIKGVMDDPDYKLNVRDTGVLKKWHIFNLSLRNELAGARAGRKKVDPLKYIRHDIYILASITHAAMSAYRNQNILEAEKILDLERWHFLDEVSLGRYFDIDLLIVYALKLKILIRWDKINNADKEALLKGTINRN